MTLETLSPVASDLDPAIRALLPNYIRRRESDVETIAQLISQEDFQEVGRLAHNMRGSGAAYGFPQITELGGLIEDAAKKKDLEALHKLATEFGAYVKQMRPA